MNDRILYGLNPSLVLDNPIQRLTNTKISIVNNVQIINFRKTMVTSDAVLNTLNYLLFAQGSYALTPNVSLTYHTFRQLSIQKVNLLTCPGIFATKILKIYHNIMKI